MATKWLDAPLSEYVYHKSAEAESGYDYHLYIHPKGQAIIMRETIATGDIQYADGGIDGANWSDRATQDYVNYNNLG